MTRQDLIGQRHALVAYLQSKVDAHDWHGVADAAMDLRELDAALRMLDRLQPRSPDAV